MNTATNPRTCVASGPDAGRDAAGEIGPDADSRLDAIAGANNGAASDRDADDCDADDATDAERLGQRTRPQRLLDGASSVPARQPSPPATCPPREDCARR